MTQQWMLEKNWTSVENTWKKPRADYYSEALLSSTLEKKDFIVTVFIIINDI